MWLKIVCVCNGQTYAASIIMFLEKIPLDMSWLDISHPPLLVYLIGHGSVMIQLVSDYKKKKKFWSLCIQKCWKKCVQPVLYIVEYETERQTLPSCMMLSVTWVANTRCFSYQMLNMTQWYKTCRLVHCWMWHSEADTAIFYVLCNTDWETNTASLYDVK